MEFDLEQVRKRVDPEGGCIVSGGAVNPSLVDDIGIHVKRPLDLDGDGQFVASILSNKIVPALRMDESTSQ